MLPCTFCFPDNRMPRTVYYEALSGAVKRNKRFSGNGASLLIPAEDTAIETNWPRYGRQASAYLRGRPHTLEMQGQFVQYVLSIIAAAKSNPDKHFLIVNMHPLFRIAHIARNIGNLLIADGSLSWFERSLNPRTISMPALPIIQGELNPEWFEQKKILATFQGVLSHPVRQALHSIQDGVRIVVKLVDPGRHKGKLDATTQAGDEEYAALMRDSYFAFVPRGDALFSYRLLEAMSFGCIPVILSDGWALPFDRTLDWNRFSIRFSETQVAEIPRILTGMEAEEIRAFQVEVQRVYQSVFCSIDKIVDQMLLEAETIVHSKSKF